MRLLLQWSVAVMVDSLIFRGRAGAGLGLAVVKSSSPRLVSQVLFPLLLLRRKRHVMLIVLGIGIQTHCGREQTSCADIFAVDG